MKRQRGRGRRPGGGGGGGGGHQQHNNNPNRTMESNGPETKVRGPAAVIHERYLQLARDAASSGDRVLSENYLQHADHYFRLWRSTQPAQPAPQPVQDRFNDAESEGDEDSTPEGVEEAEAATEGEEQPDVEFPQGQQQGYDREGGRRRGRNRNRYRPGEGEGAEAREGGEDRGERRPSERAEGEPREERRPRARAEGEQREERRPRDRDRDSERESGPEGFSNGPKPAFLRGE